MGKTAFSGPLYGAKSLLFSAHRDNMPVTTTTAIQVASIRVPAYEQWLITEFAVFRGSSGNTAVTTTYSVLDDSTSVATAATTSSEANVLLSTVIAATAGEYEGYLVANNSTLTFQADYGGSSVGVDSNVTYSLYGYIRFLSSTRPES